MREQTVCFSGHRDIPKTEYKAIKKRLEAEIVDLVKQGACYFGAGGALGFDTMAALAVFKVRRKFPHIKLILVLPCKDQTKGWRGGDIRKYGRILRQADKAVYTSEHYYDGCMQKRNRHLVDHSRVCVCYLKEPNGGTVYTVDCAIKKGLRIISLV